MVNNDSWPIDFVDGFQTSPPNPSENRLQLRTLRLPLLLPLPAFHLKIRAHGNPQQERWKPGMGDTSSTLW